MLSLKACAILLVLLVPQGKTHFDPAVHEATLSFPYEDFRIVPVRVHLLRSRQDDALNSRLEAADVDRIFSKVNRIWNKAGVHIRVESTVIEDAVVPAEFNGRVASLDEFKKTRPEESLAEGMLHVYFVHRLPTNGVYQGRDCIFVKDTASLREVKGGVDEPIPRVTSHEIGHAMSLPHRQDTINLLASGTTGWSLNDAEIRAVREWARKTAWTLTPAAALEKKLYATLQAIPGDSPLKEKAKAAAASPGSP